MNRMRTSILSLSLAFSSFVSAESWSIRISEDAIEKKSTQPQISQPEMYNSRIDMKFSESNTEGKVSYFNNSSDRSLNPERNRADAQELANSIEVEMYEMSESSSSKVIFESKSGICYGFKSKSGVVLVGETTYYLKPMKKNEEYYTNIVMAKIFAHDKPKDIQYAPVFYIQDAELAQRVQNLKDDEIIAYHLKKGTNVLNKIICR